MNNKVKAAKMQKYDNHNSPSKSSFNNMSININNSRHDAIPEDIKYTPDANLIFKLRPDPLFDSHISNHSQNS